MDILAILKLLESSGLANTLMSALGKTDNVKLDFIKILVSKMDKEGKCVVKDVLDEVLDKKHIWEGLND